MNEKAVVLSAFVSSKGGSGATLLCVNTSAVLARNKKVLLLDFHMCNSSVLLGGEDTDAGLIRGALDGSISPEAINSLLPSHPSGLKYATLSGLTGSEALSFVTLVSGKFDIVTLCSRDAESGAVELIRRASRVFLVTVPELPALKNVSRCFRQFNSLHVGSGKVSVVLNRSTGAKQELFSATSVIGRDPDICVPCDENEVMLSVNSGQLLSEGKNVFTESLGKLAEVMVASGTSELAGKSTVTKAVKTHDVKSKVHSRLIPHLKEKKIDIANKEELSGGKLDSKVREAVEELFAQEAAGVAEAGARAVLVNEIIQEAIGLGPLEDLLADDSISEIMVNSKNSIYVEKAGRLTLSGREFSSDAQLLSCIERIVAPIGRRIDESSPMVDARLPDGSRVNAVIPPLALKGPCLTIRKFSKKKLGIEDLIRFGSITEEAAGFIHMAVRSRRNIVVSGGTGSGKTTLLNVISSFIPEDERIVTIEDSAELSLMQEHVVILESRPANIEGKGAISIRDLVKNALRMRPDRIIIGECRSGEALDMLQAMNTGHDGSLTTLHSNSPRDTLSRLETMVLMAGMDLPLRAIREQISSAIDVIVHQERTKDGRRSITHITEVSGMEGDVILTQDIYKSNGKVLVPTGIIPASFNPA